MTARQIVQTEAREMFAFGEAQLRFIASVEQSLDKRVSPVIPENHIRA